MMNAANASPDVPAQSAPAWFTTLTWTPVDKDAFNKLTPEEKLTRIRHSSAHVLADALQELFPGTQFATGPATPQGFFYDVKTPQVLKEEHLAPIQEKIDKITGRSLIFETAEITKAQAVELFTAWNQPHKLEIIQKIPVDVLTLYRHGTFVDLCAGPHVPHTGLCRNMKAMSLAATHWHGEDIPSLTRVGGTAWSTPKDLQRYLEFLEVAKQRDHRVLGPQLDLFSFHPWAASAMWHPKGVMLRNLLMSFWREMIEGQDYIEILNPLLYKKELFETSGHWDHFQENMFIFPNQETGEAEFALKPMNCPDTMLFFKSAVRSYRDLPMRVAEGQILHRNEATGALHGIMRTRNFVQDDAHLFVTGEHIQDEIQQLLTMLDQVYSTFQLEYRFRLSTRPENFMGSPDLWDQAEAGLQQALENVKAATGRAYEVDPGEGAFYGPKIDVTILDSLGREWQCGTVQLDFQLPERFDLHYVAADGSYQRPIVIHRAIYGSFERFIGILIEHLGGAFPTWLAPVQVAVIPISERHADYAHTVAKTLKAAKIRTTVVEDNDTLNYRIRQCETQKIPFMLVVGDREAEEGTVAVRRYRSKGKNETMPLDALKTQVLDAIATKVLDVQVDQFGDLFRKPSDTISTEGMAY